MPVPNIADVDVAIVGALETKAKQAENLFFGDKPRNRDELEKRTRFRNALINLVFVYGHQMRD